MKIKLFFSAVILFACLPSASIALAEEGAKLSQAAIDEVVSSQAMPTGKMLADNCSACHGTKGAEFNEAMPPLAGMDKHNFIKLMKDFRENKFPTVVMHDVAYVFTDAEIAAMADYFAQQEAQQWVVDTSHANATKEHH